MANSFNVPFDYNPTSVSVKTSSYTVPAGSYAYVINSSNGAFSIDSVDAVLSPDGFTYTNLTTSTSANDYTITANGLYTIYLASTSWSSGSVTFYADISQNGGTNFINALNITNVGSNVYGQINVYLEKGNVVRTYKSGNSANGNAVMTGCRESIVSGGFWVPSGTDLDGDRYIVALYNEIS